MENNSPLIEVTNLSTGYGQLQVLSDVSLEIQNREIVSLIGANGAGKTTLVKALIGLLPCWEGSIEFKDQIISDWSAPRRVENGIVLIPEGRGILSSMTVRENLLMGAYARDESDQIQGEIEEIFERFPILEERQSNPAGQLSGGEQQMLAISRGLLADPEVLMLDEPSLGLAPLIFQDILELLNTLNEQGVTIFLVEQNATKALELSGRAYVLENGSITLEGTPEHIKQNKHVIDAYLGGQTGS